MFSRNIFDLKFMSLYTTAIATMTVVGEKQPAETTTAMIVANTTMTTTTTTVTTITAAAGTTIKNSFVFFKSTLSPHDESN